MVRDDDAYIHFQECLTSLNRAWVILGRLDAPGIDPVLWTASFQMALIEYAKPFKKSHGTDNRRHSLAFPWLSADDAALHAQLLDLRDQVLAHSDLTVKEATLYLGEVGGKIMPFIVSNTAPRLPTKEQVQQLIERVLDAWYAQIPVYESLFQSSP